MTICAYYGSTIRIRARATRHGVVVAEWMWEGEGYLSEHTTVQLAIHLQLFLVAATEGR